MHKIKMAFLVTFIVAITGCATTLGTDTRDPLPVGQSVPDDNAVALVAVTGPFAVNYIQLCHSRIGDCLNYNFPPLANDVIALPVPFPKFQIELNSYTLAGRTAGYVPLGSGAFIKTGYLTIQDRPFDLTSKSVYFHVQIDTAESGKFSSTLSQDVIRRAAEKYGKALTLIQPVNFLWP